MILRVGKVGGLGRSAQTGPSGPRAWRPSDQAGLSLWLRPSGILRTGTNYTGWNDSSANNNDAGDNDSTSDGTEVDHGYTANYSSSAISSSASLNAGVADFIVAARIKFTTFDTNAMVIGKDSFLDSTYEGFFVQVLNATQLRVAIRNNGTDIYLDGNHGMSLDTYYTFMFERVGDAWRWYRGTTQVAATTGADNINIDNSVPFKLWGGDEISNSAGCAFKGVVMFKATADATLRTNLDTYLASL